MGMTKEQRESYLDDVQILRERGMSKVQIAETLAIHKRQLDRWIIMLRSQRRWRTINRLPTISHRNKDTYGRWIST